MVQLYTSSLISYAPKSQQVRTEAGGGRGGGVEKVGQVQWLRSTADVDAAIWTNFVARDRIVLERREESEKQQTKDWITQ